MLEAWTGYTWWVALEKGFERFDTVSHTSARSVGLGQAWEWQTNAFYVVSVQPLPPFYNIQRETCKSESQTEMGLEFEAVGDLALHVILTNLGPKDTARAACVSKKLRSSASEDSLWSKFCSQDLDLNQPLDPLGNPTPTFKVLSFFDM